MQLFADDDDDNDDKQDTDDEDIDDVCVPSHWQRRTCLPVGNEEFREHDSQHPIPHIAVQYSVWLTQSCCSVHYGSVFICLQLHIALQYSTAQHDCAVGSGTVGNNLHAYIQGIDSHSV